MVDGLATSSHGTSASRDVSMTASSCADVSRAKQRRRLGLPQQGQRKQETVPFISRNQAKPNTDETKGDTMRDGRNLPGITEERSKVLTGGNLVINLKGGILKI
jgi:hypothetical protein